MICSSEMHSLGCLIRILLLLASFFLTERSQMTSIILHLILLREEMVWFASFNIFIELLLLKIVQGSFSLAFLSM